MQGQALEVSGILVRSFEVMLLLTIAPLAALAGVGVVLSLLLSVLQVNDQALPVAIKLVTMIVVTLVVGSWMSETLLSLSKDILVLMERL